MKASFVLAYPGMYNSVTKIEVVDGDDLGLVVGDVMNALA